MITRRLIDKIDNFKFRKEGQDMKLYISVDMEGLAGITHWKDETEERERFRKAMNQQVEWVLWYCTKQTQCGNHTYYDCGFSWRR